MKPGLSAPVTLLPAPISVLVSGPSTGLQRGINLRWLSATLLAPGTAVCVMNQAPASSTVYNGPALGRENDCEVGKPFFLGHPPDLQQKLGGLQ